MSATSLKHQIFFYLLCGAMTTSLDFMLYTGMYKAGIDFDAAKATSFLIATCVSYFLNKHITFKTQGKARIEFTQFVVVHVAAMSVDVLMNHVFVSLLSSMLPGQIKMTAAFIFATGCSVIVNFSGQRYWVFRRRQWAC